MNDIPEWIHFDIIHPDHVKLCSSSSNSPLFASVGGRVSSARRTFQLCEAWPQSATGLQSVLHQLQSRQARNLQLSLSTTWVVIHEFTSLPCAVTVSSLWRERTQVIVLSSSFGRLRYECKWTDTNLLRYWKRDFHLKIFFFCLIASYEITILTLKKQWEYLSVFLHAS